MKRIFIALFSTIISISAFSQGTIGSFRQIRFFPITSASDTTASVSNNGHMWYDFSTDQFRIIKNGSKFSIGTGNAAATTASNGLTKVGNDIRLGGALIQNTDVTGDFDLNLGTSANKLKNFNVITSSAGTGANISWSDLPNTVSFGSIGTTPPDGLGGGFAYMNVAVNGKEIELELNPDQDRALLAVANWPNFRGLEYSGDHSADYSNRSLVDKEYVDGLVVTASNGLTKVGNDIRMGSSSPFTDIELTSDAGGSFNTFITGDGLGGGLFSITVGDNGSGFNLIDADNVQNVLFGNGNGLAYGANYAANFTDFSLVDRAYVLSAKEYSDGATQTMNPNGTNAGINVGIQAGDPSSLQNGDIWYNSSTGNLRARIGGSSVTLGTGTIAGTIASTQVGYGSGSNTITSESAFTYNAALDALTVPTITNSGLTTISSSSNDVLINGGDDVILQATDDINISGTDLIVAASATASIQGATSITLNTAAIDIPGATANITNTTVNGNIQFSTNGTGDVAIVANDVATLVGVTSSALNGGNSNIVRADASGVDIELDAPADAVVISQPSGGTATMTLFEGELQINDVAGSDVIAVNDEGIQFTGTTSPPQIINATSSTSVIMLDNVLFTSTTASPFVAPGPTTLYTFSIPAATMFADGQSLHFELWYEIANNANVKTVSVTIGGTTVASSGTISGATLDLTKITGTVTRNAATTGFACDTEIEQTTGGVSTTTMTFNNAAAITWSGANTMSVSATGTSNNDIIGVYFKVWYSAQ